MEIDFVIRSHGNFQFLIKNFIGKPTKLVTFQFLYNPLKARMERVKMNIISKQNAVFIPPSVTIQTLKKCNIY